jgi:uncharacterized DUF497 family protein
MFRPIKPLVFDWDQGNREKNWLKHQVRFDEAEQVFFHRPILFFVDRPHSVNETRFLAYGRTDRDRRLTLVFAIRRHKIRIISVRDQSRPERKIYEKK